MNNYTLEEYLKYVTKDDKLDLLIEQRLAEMQIDVDNCDRMDTQNCIMEDFITKIQDLVNRSNTVLAEQIKHEMRESLLEIFPRMIIR